MRARGAQVTDLAVLVVAADDGVMPQTREAIDHSRAAHVPIIVALNKVDKPNANPDLVKQQLADLGLQVEEWGGDVICVPMSAKRREGIDDLLENILLVAEVDNLRANPNCPAMGTVVEGTMDKSRGPLASVLIQNGTLRVGDAVIVGRVAGRVRNMLNDKGKPVREALPATPVSIMGLSEVARPGDILEVVDNENLARAMAARRSQEAREVETTAPVRPVSLDDVFAQIQAGKVKELNLILKANVHGSIEPIQSSLEKLGTDDLKVRMIHVGTGNVTESDVSLAVASKAIIIAFSVDADAAARRLAEQEGIDIRFYNIIYKLIEDVDKALKGMLEPVYPGRGCREGRGAPVVPHPEERHHCRVHGPGRQDRAQCQGARRARWGEALRWPNQLPEALPGGRERGRQRVRVRHQRRRLQRPAPRVTSWSSTRQKE